MEVVTDTVQLRIKENFLETLEPGQFVRSVERPINGIDGLTWQLVIYVNGETNDYFGFLQAYIILSKGDFETNVKISIYGSDIKHEFKMVQATAGRIGHPMTVFHGDIRGGSFIEDGGFIVQGEIRIKRPVQSQNHIGNGKPAIRTFEDSCILKLNPDTLHLKQTGEAEITENRRINGISWNVAYFPNGEIVEETNHVKVKILISGGPALMYWTAGLTIGDTTIYKGDDVQLMGVDSTGARIASHEQIKAAKVNGVTEIRINVKFSKDANYITFRDKGNHAVSSSQHMLLAQGLFDSIYNGEFESTQPKKLLPQPQCNCVQSSDQYYWRIRFFPAGEDAEDSGHLTMYIDIDNPELKPVSAKGVIKIDGTDFEKTFEFQQQEVENFPLKKLVSIDDLRMKGALKGINVGIKCDVTFETH